MYAGSTRGRGTWSWWAWDHPRVCGEHFLRCFRRIRSWGSSPRMRGAPMPHQPAVPCPTDHPRVCGEHRSKTLDVMIEMGSSPRMRGARSTCENPYSLCGIIPAYAGSTLPKRRKYATPVTENRPKTSVQTLFTYQTTQLTTLPGEQQQTETETLPTTNTTHASLQKSLSVRHAENTHHRQRLQRHRLTLTRLMQSLSGVTSH